jgi:hypothetical protein
VLSVAGPWLIHQAAAAMGRLYTTLFRICKPVFSLFLCRTSLQETCLSGQDPWKNPNTFRDAREFRVTARWTVMTTEKLFLLCTIFLKSVLIGHRSYPTVAMTAPKGCDSSTSNDQ